VTAANSLHATRTLGDTSPGTLGIALASVGLCVDLGAAVMRVRSDVPAIAQGLREVYRAHAFATSADFIDLHVDVVQPAGARRWLRPQAVFRCDGIAPFDPFPAANALPLLEWGANWAIGQRCNDLLLLHAGALEKDGCALVMPALPGSGKSTLTAALSLRGWRLLSDEFGAWDPASSTFRALLKPVALKNESIAVIRGFASSAPIGPSFEGTRKGTVAHLAAEAGAVAGRRIPARPGAFVLPRWQAGSALQLERVDPHSLFGALAFNAFNYRLLGATGFEAVVQLVRRCPAWRLVYSQLDDAIAAIDGVWPEVVARAHES
jgi:HprK-related kinase A